MSLPIFGAATVRRRGSWPLSSEHRAASSSCYLALAETRLANVLSVCQKWIKVPSGTDDNSPAIHRWVTRNQKTFRAPGEAKELCFERTAVLRILSSLAGLERLCTCLPTDKSVGYFRSPWRVGLRT